MCFVSFWIYFNHGWIVYTCDACPDWRKTHVPIATHFMDLCRPQRHDLRIQTFPSSAFCNRILKATLISSLIIVQMTCGYLNCSHMHPSALFGAHRFVNNRLAGLLLHCSFSSMTVTVCRQVSWEMTWDLKRNQGKTYFRGDSSSSSIVFFYEERGLKTQHTLPISYIHSSHEHRTRAPWGRPHSSGYTAGESTNGTGRGGTVGR